MQAVPANIERLYIRPDLYSKLEDYYSDKIVNHQLLNSFILNCNMLVAYLYRIVVNASMQSNTTLEARRVYRKFVATNRQKSQRLLVSDSVLLGFEGHQLQLRHLELAHHTDGKRPQQEPGPPIDPIPSKLHVPNRGRIVGLLCVLILLVELLLFVRYVVCCYVLLDSYPRTTFITHSKTTERYKATTIMDSIKLNYKDLLDDFERPRSDVATTTTTTTTTISQDCRSKFLALFEENHNDFRIWNASVGIQSPKLLVDLLSEQKHSFQVILVEVRICCYLLASFVLTCGLLGRFVSEFVRYDITSLLFVFDPKFIAFSVQLRLNYYLDLIRSSYMNFWSTFQIASDGSLVAKGSELVYHTAADCAEKRRTFEAASDEEQDGQLEYCEADDEDEVSLQRADEVFENSSRNIPRPSSSPAHSGPISAIREALSQSSLRKSAANGQSSNVIDSICLNHQLFGDYMPTVRSQAWRQFMSIWNPLSQFLLMSSTSTAIIMLFWLYLTSNAQSADANEQLKHFLSEQGGTSLVSSVKLGQIRGQCGELPEDQMIRKFIADQLFARYLEALKQQQQQEAFKEVDRIEFVASLLQPTEIPTAIDWFVVSLGVLYTSIATSLYINAFLFTMSDLCFWLIELRMKLNICTAVLKRYDLSCLADNMLADCNRLDKYLALLEQNKNLSLTDGWRSGAGWRRQVSRCMSATSGREELESEREASEDEATWKQRVGRDCLLSPRESSERSKKIGHLFKLAFGDNSKFAGSRSGKANAHFPATDTSDLCNIDMLAVMIYLVANHSAKKRLCEQYATRLIKRDQQLDYSSSFRKTSEKFLTSTYLDFRLFQDSIDDCRNSMNFLVGYTVFHALNILISSTQVGDFSVRVGCIVAGFLIANMTLVGASFFQSQCTKLHSPIYSILAASIRSDKTVRHLALLWRRLLTDLAGSRSRFSLRVYSLNVSYATALQFNLSVASLYILAMDKTRFN